MPTGDRPNRGGGSRRWIMQEVEASLKRLRTDLHQVHRPSPDTDVEETLGALTDLVRQGKARYVGSSSYAASQIVEARWASRDLVLSDDVLEAIDTVAAPGVTVNPDDTYYGAHKLTPSTRRR